MSDRVKLTLEVDKRQLFDALHKMDGDTRHLSDRIVGSMLMDEDSAIDTLALALYGVEIHRDGVVT